ncbi:TPA: acyltransferase [Escherichia coli]|nr:acyltransferase [Escherichia coli]ELB3360799.1 acyltransferase [Escherichia coli]ELB3460795.1 acyltransferase [Escherichia coli]HAN8151622.1 acyltransferase [Escherichia coli]HAY4420337.1 acyltransferase [Escherichia coli]
MAAVAVVIDHVTHYMHKSFSGNSWIYSSNIYNVGGFGVDLFFCISGFIMVITTYNKPSGFSQSLTFLKKRFVRIYPTYWFYCILTLALPFILYGKTDLISKYDPLFLLQSFLLLPAKISECSFSPFLGQGWTLQYELYFYLIFASAILLFNGWRVVLVSSLAIFALLASSKVVDFNEYVNYLISNSIVIDFILGMISALIYISLRNNGVSISSKVSITFIVLLMTCVSYLVIEKVNIDRVVLFGLPSFFIVTFFSLSDINSSKIINKILIQLGEASYTIYLAHMVLIWSALKYSSKLKMLNVDLAITLYVGAICAAGYLMFLAIEKNITKYLSRMGRLEKIKSTSDNSEHNY